MPHRPQAILTSAMVELKPEPFYERMIKPPARSTTQRQARQGCLHAVDGTGSTSVDAGQASRIRAIALGKTTSGLNFRPPEKSEKSTPSSDWLSKSRQRNPTPRTEVPRVLAVAAEDDYTTPNTCEAVESMKPLRLRVHIEREADRRAGYLSVRSRQAL